MSHLCPNTIIQKYKSTHKLNVSSLPMWCSEGWWYNLSVRFLSVARLRNGTSHPIFATVSPENFILISNVHFKGEQVYILVKSTFASLCVEKKFSHWSGLLRKNYKYQVRFAAPTRRDASLSAGVNAWQQKHLNF